MAVETPIYDDEDKKTSLNNKDGKNSNKSALNSGGATQNNFYFGGSSLKSLGSDQLKNAESKNGSNNASSGETLYKPKTSTAELSSTTGKSKSRKKLIAAAGGGMGLILTLVMLLLFLNGLFLQSFSTALLDWQFARVNRDFANDSSQVTDEKAALDSPDPATSGESPLEDNATVAEDFNNTDGLWTKIRGYTPKGAIKNLKGDGALSYNTEKTPLLQRDVLKSITVGDQTIDVTETDPSIFTKVLHPINTFNSQVQAATDINAGVRDALGDDAGIRGILVRGGIESSIRESAGIPLYAWVASKFAGKTPTEASDLLDEDAVDRISPPSEVATPGESYQTNKAVADEQSITAKEITNAADIEAARANNGVLPDADNAASNDLYGLDSGLLAKASIAYAIAVPLCIIYDGSLQSPTAGQTIDNQDNELERSFYYVQSASDQTKAGDANAEVVGAMNTKLGDLSESNVMIRANGGSVDSLSDIQSPQAGADQQYSYVNTFLPSWLATITNDILSNSFLGCSTLTNPATGVALLAAQILVEIITSIPDGGAAGAAEEGAGAAVDVAVDSAVQEGIIASIQTRLASNVVTSTLLKASGKFAERFSKKELLKLGAVSLATAGLTVLAKQETLAKAGETYNGLSQGIDFANQADAGGNLNSNEVERQELFGAPLGAADLQYNDNSDKTYLSEINGSKSTFNRYLALSNPSSLTSKLGMAIKSSVHGSFMATIASGIKTLFNPVHLFSNIFSLVNPKKVAAANIVNNSDYGIVQWGRTAYEDSLINPTSGNPSYQPLENSQILFSSGQDQYIESMYGPCYSDTMGTLLTQKPPGTVNGYTTPDSTDPYILRDKNGNVIGGLCSEKYLGPNSADPNAFDTKSGQNKTPTNDLIFRWRLNHGYNNTLDQLIGVQNAAN